MEVQPVNVCFCSSSWWCVHVPCSCSEVDGAFRCSELGVRCGSPLDMQLVVAVYFPLCNDVRTMRMEALQFGG